MPTLPFLAEQHSHLEELEGSAPRPHTLPLLAPSRANEEVQGLKRSQGYRGEEIHSGPRRNMGTSGRTYQKLFYCCDFHQKLLTRPMTAKGQVCI